MSLTLAGCVILNKDKDIYLLHRNKGDFEQWELPGGKVETGETVERAAIRELQEELGVRVTLKRKLGEAYFNENSQEYSYTWFLAEVSEGTLAICEPETFDDLRCFSFDELSSLKLSNNMKKLYSAVLKGEADFINE